MGRNPIETIMGALVLLVAAVFLAFAYTTADLRQVRGYALTAEFLRAGGLDTGGDVRIAGIPVGTVIGQRLDPETYEAVVEMSILDSVQLPVDTRAAITSDGLLGGTYVKLVPGHASETLEPGDSIRHTNDYQSLEDLVGEIIFLATQPPPPPGAQGPSGPSGSGPGPDPTGGLLDPSGILLGAPGAPREPSEDAAEPPEAPPLEPPQDPVDAPEDTAEPPEAPSLDGPT